MDSPKRNLPRRNNNRVKNRTITARDIPNGVITAIQYQKRDKLRASVFIAGEFGVGLNVQSIERFRLRKGDEITSTLAEEMAMFDNGVSAKRIAGKFLNTRRRSEKEVRDKLKEIDTDDTIVNEVIAGLKESGLIDDPNFARSYIHDKLLSKPHSRKRLEFDLRKKGIEKAIIAEVLSEIGSDSGTEESRAMQAAEKKWPQLMRREGDSKKRQHKLTAFLASRAFDYDTIRTVVSHFSRREEQ